MSIAPLDQPARRPTRNVSTSTREELPTTNNDAGDVTGDLDQSRLNGPLTEAVNCFANAINIGSFNKLLSLLGSLLSFNDALNLANQLWKTIFTFNSNPADFLSLSLNAMIMLQNSEV